MAPKRKVYGSNLTLAFIIAFIVLTILGVSNLNMKKVEKEEKIRAQQEKIDSLENKYKDFKIQVYKDELTYHVN